MGLGGELKHPANDKPPGVASGVVSRAATAAPVYLAIRAYLRAAPSCVRASGPGGSPRPSRAHVFSEGFSKCCRSFISRNTPSRWSFFFSARSAWSTLLSRDTDLHSGCHHLFWFELHKLQEVAV